MSRATTDLITDPKDPLRQWLLAPVHRVARRRLRRPGLWRSRSPGKIPQGALAHVSGCAKGCAHSSKAALTLVARGPDGFDVVRKGRACDPPDVIGLSPARILSNPDLLTELLNAP